MNSLTPDQLEQAAESRMYIMVKDNNPVGWSALAAAHVALRCYLEFNDDPFVQAWCQRSFRKYLAVVTPKEFEQFKTKAEHLVIFADEDYPEQNKELAIAFKPRPNKEWPKGFGYLTRLQPEGPCNLSKSGR